MPVRWPGVHLIPDRPPEYHACERQRNATGGSAHWRGLAALAALPFALSAANISTSPSPRSDAFSYAPTNGAGLVSWSYPKSPVRRFR